VIYDWMRDNGKALRSTVEAAYGVVVDRIHQRPGTSDGRRSGYSRGAPAA
jgi:hypothetical protein